MKPVKLVPGFPPWPSIGMRQLGIGTRTATDVSKSSGLEHASGLVPGKHSSGPVKAEVKIAWY